MRTLGVLLLFLTTPRHVMASNIQEKAQQGLMKSVYNHMAAVSKDLQIAGTVYCTTSWFFHHDEEAQSIALIAKDPSRPYMWTSLYATPQSVNLAFSDPKQSPSGRDKTRSSGFSHRMGRVLINEGEFPNAGVFRALPAPHLDPLVFSSRSFFNTHNNILNSIATSTNTAEAPEDVYEWTRKIIERNSLTANELSQNAIRKGLGQTKGQNAPLLIGTSLIEMIRMTEQTEMFRTRDRRDVRQTLVNMLSAEDGETSSAWNEFISGWINTLDQNRLHPDLLFRLKSRFLAGRLKRLSEAPHIVSFLIDSKNEEFVHDIWGGLFATLISQGNDTDTDKKRFQAMLSDPNAWQRELAEFSQRKVDAGQKIASNEYPLTDLSPVGHLAMATTLSGIPSNTLIGARIVPKLRVADLHRSDAKRAVALPQDEFLESTRKFVTDAAIDQIAAIHGSTSQSERPMPLAEKIYDMLFPGWREHSTKWHLARHKQTAKSSKTTDLKPIIDTQDEATTALAESNNLLKAAGLEPLPSTSRLVPFEEAKTELDRISTVYYQIRTREKWIDQDYTRSSMAKRLTEENPLSLKELLRILEEEKDWIDSAISRRDNVIGLAEELLLIAAGDETRLLLDPVMHLSAVGTESLMSYVQELASQPDFPGRNYAIMLALQAQTDFFSVRKIAAKYDEEKSALGRRRHEIEAFCNALASEDSENISAALAALDKNIAESASNETQNDVSFTIQRRECDAISSCIQSIADQSKEQ